MSAAHNPTYFPIHPGDTRDMIPLRAVLRHQAQAVTNHGQPVHSLAERGGLTWQELAAVLEDRPFRQMDPDVARLACLGVVASEEAACAAATAEGG